jgi:hypothetical protein
MVTDEDVLDTIIQGVAHMQDTGDIWWWDDYTKRRFERIRLGREKVIFFPKPVPFFFAFQGVITGGNLNHL